MPTTPEYVQSNYAVPAYAADDCQQVQCMAAQTFVLLPRGAQLLLVEVPKFLEARKCWDSLTPADKQALLDSLFYTVLYRPIPKTKPHVYGRFGKAVQAPSQLRAPVTQQVGQIKA